jgi:hypothetical protein
MVFTHEFKEYNINLIFLNSLISEEIELNISNFLYENNLSLNLSSRDLKNIFKHFIIDNIIKQIKIDYDNILIINYNFNLKYLNSCFDEEFCIPIIIDILKKSIKIFNFNVFETQNEKMTDLQLIYKLRSCIQNKNKFNYKKIIDYTQKNNLSHLNLKLKNCLQTKRLLNK